jgi:hypothetical protein
MGHSGVRERSRARMSNNPDQCWFYQVIHTEGLDRGGKCWDPGERGGVGYNKKDDEDDD